MRIAICQSLVPAYRAPLFERLGALPGVELTVYAGESMGSLKACHSGSSYRVVPVRVHRWRSGLAAHTAQVSALWRNRCQLLILPWDIRFVTLPVSIILARSLGVPVVLWGHGYSLRPNALIESMRSLSGKCADSVLLYSRSVAARLISERRYPRERVFVAPNALDQTPIQAARHHWGGRLEELSAFRREHGLDPNRTLVFISRLEASNQIDLLLRATAELATRHAGLKTVIIGDGGDRGRLERLAQTLGIRDRVVFTGPLYDEIALAPWMMSGSLFCYPTNVGLSLLHAFGYGLPAVISDDTWAQNPEVEAHIPDWNGLRYRAGDVQDMTRQCDRLLSDETLRRALSDAALQTALERYSMDQMIDGFKQVLEWASLRRGAQGKSVGEP